VLANCARRLRGAVRGGDHVARWGGDEFVVLCPDVADIAEAMSIAERLRRAVSAPFSTHAGTARIGVSVGVALDDGHPSPEQLLSDADRSLYRAKVDGRGRVVLAGA
jgi:diguanylate cyclase (GGDEF)-like protein